MNSFYAYFNHKLHVYSIVVHAILSLILWYLYIGTYPILWLFPFSFQSGRNDGGAGPNVGFTYNTSLASLHTYLGGNVLYLK